VSVQLRSVNLAISALDVVELTKKSAVGGDRSNRRGIFQRGDDLIGNCHCKLACWTNRDDLFVISRDYDASCAGSRQKTYLHLNVDAPIKCRSGEVVERKREFFLLFAVANYRSCIIIR